MNGYLWLKFLHELAVFWFFAGIIGRQLVRAVARRSDDVNQFAMLSSVAGRFEKLMVIPGNMLVLVFGVMVALQGGWPIFGFLEGAEANWLLLSNVILLGGLLLVPLVYAPKGKHYDRALQEALQEGIVTVELTAILDDRAVRWAHRGEYAGLLIVVLLMVLKPL